MSPGDSTEKYYSWFAVTLLVLCIGLLYVGMIPANVLFNIRIIPSGDPYTYTLSFFRISDMAHGHFLEALEMALFSNWYSLINLMVLFFAPILVKEPFSLAITNYFVFGLATVSYYRLARSLRLSVPFSFVLSWVLWIFPVNFGFLAYESVPVMALDAMFIGILNVAVANLLVFALDPKNKKNAILAGLAVGAAFWGRGNSLPVVGLVAFPMVCVLIWKSFTSRKWRHFVLFACLAVGFCFSYYWMHWRDIVSYYSVAAAISSRHHWQLHDTFPYLRNIPGYYFWRVENSIPTFVMTWVCHLFMAFAGYYIFGKQRLDSQRQLAAKLLVASGVFIYFCTYFANMIVFADPAWTIQNCSIYAPMRIGLTLGIFALLMTYVCEKGLRVTNRAMAITAVFMVVYGTQLTFTQMPKRNSDAPSPLNVEGFAKNFTSLLGKGKVTFLWQQFYNLAMLDYYRAKNGMPFLTEYRYQFHDDAWAEYDFSEQRRRKLRQELEHVLAEADFIVIGEYLDIYSENYPYAIFKMREEIARSINSPKAPRFRVRVVIQVYPHARLFVIQRESKAKGRGIPLPLPYGFKKGSSAGNRDFSGIPFIEH